MAQTDDPGAVGIAQQVQAPAMDICRAVYGGTLYLRDHSEFLPQWEKEEDDAYADRLGTSVLFNAYKKTVTSLTGIVFREKLSLGEDIPEEILEHLKNIDLSGQHVDLFAQREFREKLIDGHTLILVDWHGPDGARSKGEELAAEARPYWTLVLKGQVKRHWPRQDGGAVVLVSWAYEEKEIIPDGDFAQKEISRIRQFDLADTAGNILDSDIPLPERKQRRVLFRSWIQEEEGGQWTFEGEEEGKLLGERMTQIPVVVDYGERTGYMLSDPVLLDLALENLKHWAIRSDRDQNLHVTSIPILNVYGMEAKDIQAVTVGTSMGLAFPEGKIEQGSEYTEAQGHGLEHTRTELQDIQQRMAALGTSMLERQVRVAETDKAKMLDQKAQDSELAALSRLSTDALVECLVLHALWMGIENGGGTLAVNTDFSTDEMSPELFDKYLKAVGEGRLTLETFWNRLVAGRLLPETFDPKLERAMLEKEGVAELEAAAEIARKVKQEEGTPSGSKEEEE